MNVISSYIKALFTVINYSYLIHKFLIEQLPKEMKIHHLSGKDSKALRAHSKSTKNPTFPFSGFHLDSTSSRVSTEIA